MRKKLLHAVALSMLCVVALSACGKKETTKPSLDGLTFDIPETATVEIGEAFWLSEKKAVDEKGQLYKPEVKVYRDGKDVTEEEVKADVFFQVEEFVSYRVEYTVRVDGAKKVFSTDITVVDTTAPTVALNGVSETMTFDSSFKLTQSMFEVTDNSGEAVSPTFVVTQVNGSRRTELESDGEGAYELLAGYVGSLEVAITASDSRGNAMDEVITIKNADASVITLPQKDGYNTLWTANAVEYFYSQETVNEETAEVLTFNMDVSNIANAKALNFLLKFDTEIQKLPGTLEFDVWMDNMCNWLSVMPFNGAQKGKEVGASGFGNGIWHHCTIELENIDSMDSLIFHIQPTTKQWWGEKLNVYDSTKLTTLKLANIKYTEKAPIVAPDEIPEHTLVDCNAEYAITCVTTKAQSNGAVYGSHTVAWTDTVKYEGETGSLKLTATNGENGYFILSNPLLTNVSGYDYIEFHVFNPNANDMKISTVWKEAFTIKAGEWGTVRLYVSDIIAGSITEPFSGTVLTAADITTVSFYVREIAQGESVYISSIKAVKEAE